MAMTPRGNGNVGNKKAKWLFAMVIGLLLITGGCWFGYNSFSNAPLTFDASLLSLLVGAVLLGLSAYKLTKLDK